MNKVDILISQLESERSKAFEEMQNERGFDKQSYDYFKGKYDAFDLTIKFALLLKTDTKASNQ